MALAVDVAEFKDGDLKMLVPGHPGFWALHMLRKVSLPLDFSGLLSLLATVSQAMPTLYFPSTDTGHEIHLVSPVCVFSVPLYLHLCL